MKITLDENLPERHVAILTQLGHDVDNDSAVRWRGRKQEISFMPNATISVDAALKARLAEMASQTNQQVDEFVEALLRRIADADLRFERGVPVLPRRPGAPTVTAEDVDRLIEDDL